MGSLMSKQDGKPSPNSYSGTHEEEGKTRKPLLEPDTQRQVTSEVQAQVQQRPSTQRNGNDLDGIRSTAGLTRRQLRHISSSSSDDYERLESASSLCMVISSPTEAVIQSDPFHNLVNVMLENEPELSSAIDIVKYVEEEIKVIGIEHQYELMQPFIGGKTETPIEQDRIKTEPIDEGEINTTQPVEEDCCSVNSLSVSAGENETTHGPGGHTVAMQVASDQAEKNRPVVEFSLPKPAKIRHSLSRELAMLKQDRLYPIMNEIEGKDASARRTSPRTGYIKEDGRNYRDNLQKKRILGDIAENNPKKKKLSASDVATVPAAADFPSKNVSPLQDYSKRNTKALLIAASDVAQNNRQSTKSDNLNQIPKPEQFSAGQPNKTVSQSAPSRPIEDPAYTMQGPSTEAQ